MNWHEDFNHEKIRTEIITHDRVDARMRVRPNPSEVERAARLLVEARNPLLIVGDEIYKAKAFAKAVQLAELLALPVTQARQVFSNFPQNHPLWISDMPGGRIDTVAYPRQPDVVINVGNKMQHNSPALMVPRTAKFIDLRIDSASMNNVLSTTVPLVADVGIRPGRSAGRGQRHHDAGHQGGRAGAVRARAGVQRERATPPPSRRPESRLGPHADAARPRQLRDCPVGRPERGHRP